MIPSESSAKTIVQKTPDFDNWPKMPRWNPVCRHCQIQNNGLIHLNLGLKWSLRSWSCSQNYSAKLGSTGPQILIISQKLEAICNVPLAEKIWEHLQSWSRPCSDHFEPNYRSLGPLVRILQYFEWQHSRFHRVIFWHIIKLGGSVDLIFDKIYSGNIISFKIKFVDFLSFQGCVLTIRCTYRSKIILKSDSAYSN